MNIFNRSDRVSPLFSGLITSPIANRPLRFHELYSILLGNYFSTALTESLEFELESFVGQRNYAIIEIINHANQSKPQVNPVIFTVNSHTKPYASKPKGKFTV